MDINGIQERLDSRAFKILPFRELVPVVLGVPAGLFAGIGTAEFTGASLFVWIWAFVMPLVMITLWLSDSITDRFDGKLGRLIISRSFSVCSLAALQFFTFGLMCFVLIDSVPRDFQGRFVGNEIVFIWLGIISALIVVLMGQVLVALSWDSLCGTKTKPVLEKITGFFYAFYGLIILGLTGYSVGLLGMSEYSILIYLPAIAYGISYAVLGFSWIQVASRHGTDDEALVRFLSRQGIGHACLGLSLLIAAVFMELATYLTVDSFASIYIMMLMPLAAMLLFTSFRIDAQAKDFSENTSLADSLEVDSLEVDSPEPAEDTPETINNMEAEDIRGRDELFPRKRKLSAVAVVAVLCVAFGLYSVIGSKSPGQWSLEEIQSSVEELAGKSLPTLQPEPSGTPEWRVFSTILQDEPDLCYARVLQGVEQDCLIVVQYIGVEDNSGVNPHAYSNLGTPTRGCVGPSGQWITTRRNIIQGEGRERCHLPARLMSLMFEGAGKEPDALGSANIDSGPSVQVDGMTDLGSAEIDAVVGEAGGVTSNGEPVDLGGVSEGALGRANIDSGPSVQVDGMVDLGSAEIDAVAGEARGVTSVVRRYKNRLKLCYDQALSRDPQLSGRVEIFFMVGGGRVLESSIEGNTTYDAELASCILRKVNGFRFDLDLEADVSYPFILSTQ